MYRLDIPEGVDDSAADRVSVSTEFAGAKAHLGSSVLYTVQLEDADGAVAVGVDGEKPASFFVTLSTYAIIENPAFDAEQPIAANNQPLINNPQGASVTTTLPLTTDTDGKVTFSVSGLPDSDSDQRDKYRVYIHIQPQPDGNAPNVVSVVDGPLPGTTTSAAQM